MNLVRYRVKVWDQIVSERSLSVVSSQIFSRVWSNLASANLRFSISGERRRRSEGGDTDEWNGVYTSSILRARYKSKCGIYMCLLCLESLLKSSPADSVFQRSYKKYGGNGTCLSTCRPYYQRGLRLSWTSGSTCEVKLHKMSIPL